MKKVKNSLTLQGTTGKHENAIYGTVTLDIFCLLKKNFDTGKSFGRSKITFLICSPEVKLNKIILGSPWLKSVTIDMRLADNGNKATARLFLRGDIHRVSLQLKRVNNLTLTSCDNPVETDNLSKFEINTFFLQREVSLKIHEKDGIKMPGVVHLKNEYKVKHKRGFPYIFCRRCSESRA